MGIRLLLMGILLLLMGILLLLMGILLLLMGILLLLMGIALLLMGIGLFLMGIGRRLTTGRGPSVRRRRVILRRIRVRHRASLHDGCGGAHSLAFKTIPVESGTRDSDDRQEKLDDRMKSTSPQAANGSQTQHTPAPSPAHSQ